MRPFFSYYGAKWRLSALLPPPRYGRIEEPFAGSACYATRHPDTAEVVLGDVSPGLCALWRWLISCPREEFLRLPDLPEGGDLRDLRLRPEARWLIGLRIGQGDAQPRRRWSPFGGGTEAKRRRAWSAEIREELAADLERIRHWTVREGPFSAAGNALATWIVDPPYQGPAGFRYASGRWSGEGSGGSNVLDFDLLGRWVRRRAGLVAVHEGADASWFPEASVVGSIPASGHRGGRGLRSLERVAVFDTLTRENLSASVAERFLEADLKRVRTSGGLS